MAGKRRTTAVGCGWLHVHPCVGKCAAAGKKKVLSVQSGERVTTTLSALLARKQKLLQRLQENPGLSERAEIEGFIAQIDTALNLLEEPGESSDEQ